MLPSRRPDRRRTLSITVIVLGLLLAVAHYRAGQRGRIGGAEEGILAALQPAQKALLSVGTRIASLGESLRGILSAEAENRVLRRRIVELQTKNARLRYCFEENRRLRTMLNLTPLTTPSYAAAEVVSVSPSNWFSRVGINRGTSDGVRSGDLVMAPGGLVGQVVLVARRRAQVLLLTDQQSGVGAMVQRSRARGVLQGTGGNTCNLVYLTTEADVRVGDAVVTSGLGDVFQPKGLFIGSVIALVKDLHSSTQVATVQPAVDLGKLEEVFLLHGQPSANP